MRHGALELESSPSNIKIGGLVNQFFKKLLNIRTKLIFEWGSYLASKWLLLTKEVHSYAKISITKLFLLFQFTRAIDWDKKSNIFAISFFSGAPTGSMSWKMKPRKSIRSFTHWSLHWKRDKVSRSDGSIHRRPINYANIHTRLCTLPHRPGLELYTLKLRTQSFGNGIFMQNTYLLITVEKDAVNSSFQSTAFLLFAWMQISIKSDFSYLAKITNHLCCFTP